MQTENRLFDDIARVAGGAFGIVAGLRNEVEDLVRQRLERYFAELDVVPREEFDVLQAMLEKARRKQEALEKRVAALEAAAAPRPAARRKKPSSGEESRKQPEDS